MEEKYCGCCGMPMGCPSETVGIDETCGTGEMYGTEANGSKSGDYCKFCYENGEFTAKCTMEEMIKFCVPHMTNANSGMSEDEAINMMKEFFPTLKRWKNTV